jgi:hypothetical protein
MTIKQVKNIIDFVTNKYQLGYMSGEEFNSIFRLAEVSNMSFLIGKLQQYQPGRPIPRVGLDMNKQIVERLAPFRFTVAANNGSLGEVRKMSDIAAVETMNKTDGTRIYWVAPNRLSYYLNSSVWNLDNQPVYAEYDTYYRVYPANMDIVITAIRVPPYSKWAYNVVDDVEIYDNLGSTDPIWKDVDVVEIIGRMCKHIGVSLKDGELMNYAQSIINQGE